MQIIKEKLDIDYINRVKLKDEYKKRIKKLGKTIYTREEKSDLIWDKTKTKEYKYGIIYIRGKDEFQMQNINSAFDYIPDETNDSVIYMKDPIPIEIGVKPVNMETIKNDTSIEES